MPNRAILFIDHPPVVAIDATGVNLAVGSGSYAYRVRYDRATWRKTLECALRQLDEYEMAERIERGRVLAFPAERRA